MKVRIEHDWMRDRVDVWVYDAAARMYLVERLAGGTA